MLIFYFIFSGIFLEFLGKCFITENVLEDFVSESLGVFF
jgi:hypothetical protein